MDSLGDHYDVDSDSLFGSEVSHDDTDDSGLQPPDSAPIASRTAPQIPGTFYFPELLSRQLHDLVLHQVSECGYFDLEDDNETQRAGGMELDAAYQRSPRNQAMLFASSLTSPSSADHGGASGVQNEPSDCSGLPSWAIELIHQLRQLLTSLPDHHLPADVKDMLFPKNRLLSRQLILNLYNGAEGLAPHVDLVHRFADGILLCSFGPHGTGTVMDFSHEAQPRQHLFLPSGSVLVLSGEARYDWKHGITARDCDLVRSADGSDRIDALKRSIRLSITIRSMLPGADVVGE